MVTNKVTEYVSINNEWPTSIQELGLTDDSNNISLYENGVIGIKVGVAAKGQEKYIIFEPKMDEGNIVWTCYGDNVASKYLPSSCQ
jgi:hypothetical protein